MATTPSAHERARKGILTTVAAALAITTATLFGGLAPASAAVGDSSSARGQFLSGSLVGTDLATLVELEGAEAASDGTADDLDTGSLSVAVLQALQLEIAGGLQIPLDGVDLGVLEQYAAADADGSALGASGAVANDGAIGIGPLPPGGAPTSMRFTLSQLLAGVVNVGAVTDLQLELGAVSAQATGDGVAPPTGDYEIAGLRLVMNSPAIAGVSALAETAVDDVVDPLVSGLVGPGGSVVTTITGAVPELTLGVLGAGATLDVDLDAALDPLIGPAAPALGAGSPIEIDLGSGLITVDVRALLESDADPTNDLNSLAPDTEILSAAVLTLIADGVESLLDDLADDIAAAVVTAVQDAELTLDLSVSVPILGNVATIHVAGTVAEIIASTPGSVTVDVLNAAVCGLPVVGPLVCATLAATVLGALDTLLTNTVDGLVDDVFDQVQTDVIAPALLVLDPALASIVTGILSLRANVQEPDPSLLTQEFVETALRLTLLGRTTPGGGAAVLNIAQAAVGPNVAVDPVALDLDPDRGPETGGTVVTITGSDIGDATQVTFGGVPGSGIVRLSDDAITVIAPPHAPATVGVIVTGPGGSTTPLPYEYYPVTTIDDITPDQGPEAGGTNVVILGHCFLGATQVLFGATPATSFVVVNDGRIDAVAPPGVGLVDVSVVGAGTCGTGTEPDGFAYVVPNAPIVTGITPPQGPETGGTLVTLTGSNFTGVTSVTFDGIPGTAVTVASDTLMTVRTPPHVPGVVDVIVIHPVNGPGAPDDFEYIAAGVGGVTVTSGTGVLGLTGSSPWTLLMAAIQLLLAGLAIVIAANLRRRRRLL